MVDEPAGSSDYSAVYLFAVRTRKPLRSDEPGE